MPPRKRKVELQDSVQEESELYEVEQDATETSTGPMTPKNMKVVELREALTAHGLSPKGLKKDLVERLESFLESKTTPAVSSKLKDAHGEKGEEPETETETKSPSKRKQTKAVEPVDDASAAEDDKRQDEEVVLQVAERTYERNNEETKEETVKALNAIKGQPSDETVSSDNVKRMVPHDEPKETQVDSKNDTPSSNNKKKVLSNVKKDALSDENKSDQLSSTFKEFVSRTNDLSKSEHTRVVLIKNFVRPFTIPAVKDLLGQFGTINDFWMDQLKSKCFAKYDAIEMASECVRRLSGLRWPLDTGRALEAHCVTEEEMRSEIESEDSKTKASASLATQREPPTRDVPLTLDQLFMKTKSTPQLYYLPNHLSIDK